MIIVIISYNNLFDNGIEYLANSLVHLPPTLETFDLNLKYKINT